MVKNTATCFIYIVIGLLASSQLMVDAFYLPGLAPKTYCKNAKLNKGKCLVSNRKKGAKAWKIFLNNFKKLDPR